MVCERVTERESGEERERETEMRRAGERGMGVIY
jgi:hypothetical protein